MKKIIKTLVLAICGWICFAAFIIINACLDLIFYSSNIDIWSAKGLQELLSLFIIGAIICLIFGAPFLFIIDNYFNRLKYRYILGGFIAAWVAWLVIAGPLFTPSLWLRPDLWNWIYSMQFARLGMATGVLFTLVLGLFKRCKKRRQLKISGAIN